VTPDPCGHFLLWARAHTPTQTDGLFTQSHLHMCSASAAPGLWVRFVFLLQAQKHPNPEADPTPARKEERHPNRWKTRLCVCVCVCPMNRLNKHSANNHVFIKDHYNNMCVYLQLRLIKWRWRPSVTEHSFTASSGHVVLKLSIVSLHSWWRTVSIPWCSAAAWCPALKLTLAYAYWINITWRKLMSQVWKISETLCNKV